MSRNLQSTALALGLLATLSAGIHAQSGGFRPGDIYFAIAGPQAPFPDGGSGIARIDTTNGNVSVLLDMPGNSTPGTMGMAYDSFRDRIVFGGIPVSGAPLGLWEIDSNGAFSLLHADNNGWPVLIAPANHGRVYYKQASLGAAFRYVDASNTEHILKDTGGVNNYLPPWQQFSATMCFDASSNSLIIALPGTAASICSGLNTNFVVMKKIPLSADGSHVAGPEVCAQVQLSAIGSNNYPCGMGHFPNGDILLSIDPNASGVLPTFLRVDPLSLNMSVFAVAGSLNPPLNIPMKQGGYSTALGAPFDVDISTHSIRLFGAGQSGAGTLFATSVPISPAGNSPMAWMEIPGNSCGMNDVSLYCTPKTTSNGCVPALSTNGGASASAGSGFRLQCSSVEANKAGLLLYSTSAANNLPFQGGFLCVAAPIKRLSAGSSGGTTVCTGSYALDFNQVIASGSDAALIAGAQVFAQYWFRAPASSFGIGLSAGVNFGICN